MVKKMLELAFQANTSSNAQTQTKNDEVQSKEIVDCQNNPQSLTESQPLNVNNPNNTKCQQTNEIENVCLHSNSLNNNPVPKLSYRITSYPIQNKTYRLIPLGEQVSSDDDLMNEANNINLNLEDEFRQPPFLPPRFNPFTRWNNRNNERQRFARRKIKGKKSTLQSIVSSAKKLFLYIKTARLSSICQYIPFYPHSPTLYSKYSNVSLAILSNSVNLQSAVIKAMEYNIPLMQIIMNPKQATEQKIVVEKILRDFMIAHFINQNFVLYGDWACFEGYREVFARNELSGDEIGYERMEKIQMQDSGKIVFRKGEIVFAEIDLSYVGMIDRNQLQEKLQQIRDHFYRHKQLYRNPESGVSSKVSQPASSSQKSTGSNGPVQPKTVEQIEEQILKDYLEQKLQEQMAGEEQIFDELSSEDQLQHVLHAEDNGQREQQNQENYPAEDFAENMIESRKDMSSQLGSQQHKTQ